MALDAGQTGIKIRVVTAQGTFDELLPGVKTDRDVLPQLADAVTAMQGRYDEGTDLVSAGVSGLRGDHDEAAQLRALIPDVDQIILAHDSITSYLGAVGDADGAVVASGTGVVTLGVGSLGVARVDGWGNIMGDAGSGYWIGRSALDAVMRAHDGRGPATALTEQVAGRLGDLEDAYLILQSDPDRIRTIASFAAGTAQAAEAGDAVAAGILATAATELALSVSTALARAVAPDRHALVSAVGGVFGSPLVLDAVKDAVLRDRAETEFISPRGDGRDGAGLLASVTPGHPLYSHLSIAGGASHV